VTSRNLRRIVDSRAVTTGGSRLDPPRTVPVDKELKTLFQVKPMAQTTHTRNPSLMFQATRPVHCRGGSLSVTRLIVVTAVIAVSLQFLPIQASADVVTLQNATATYSQAAFGGFPAGMAIDGNFGSNNGWAIYEGTTGSGGTTPNMTHPQIAVFEAVANIGSAGGTFLTFTFHQLHSNPGHNIGRFRLSATTDDRSLFADGLSTGGDVTANWTILGTLSAISTGLPFLESSVTVPFWRVVRILRRQSTP
jgi:hypothetical protein